VRRNALQEAAPSSKIVRILRVGEARNCRIRTRARNLDPNRRLGFRTRLSQDGKARQRLVVNLGDQKGVGAVVLFPDLADLDLARGHITNVDRIPEAVNIRNPRCFSRETPRDAIGPDNPFRRDDILWKEDMEAPARVYTVGRFLRRFL
jgi:hypothetical protein